MKTLLLLEAAGIPKSRAVEWDERITEAMLLASIVNDSHVAHFLAQILHESGMLRHVVESFRYSKERLRIVFPKYFRSNAEAAAAVSAPNSEEWIANKVYADRMGNGPLESGDGWRFRGRGLLQLTGRNNYTAFSRWVRDPAILEDPGLVATRYAAMSAAWFWIENGLNEVADRQGIIGVTRRINGGTNGLTHRMSLHHRIAAAQEKLSWAGAGDRTANVRAVQKVLGVADDGDWGPKTAAAMKEAVEQGKVGVFATEA
jgi:predicted chitinase